jgi:hypothetical protein
MYPILHGSSARLVLSVSKRANSAAGFRSVFLVSSVRGSFYSMYRDGRTLINLKIRIGASCIPDRFVADVDTMASVGRHSSND